MLEADATERVAAVVFDEMTSRAWVLSSVLAFALDCLVYQSVGIFAKATTQFIMLTALGTDGSTLSRGTGKLVEQVRWLCINFYE